MYITNSAGYGAAATEIDATKDANATDASYTNGYGGFSIDNTHFPYSCGANQFAYITVTGGDTGGLTNGTGQTTPVANNNSVQMVALGSCANLTANATYSTDAAAQNATRVFISEASTVAAGYALSNFISEDPSHLGDGDQRVWVNAPSTNNDPTGSCGLTGTVTTSCLGAGLAHAFTNATGLVNAVNFSSTLPSGAANTVLATNASAAVPAAMINTIANIEAACTNSTGGTAGDSSSCGTFFAATTLPSTIATPTSLPLVPTDTLMAVVNLAKHPVGASISSVPTLYGLVPPQVAFSPSLTKAPVDYSIAIVYPSSTSTGGTKTNFTGAQHISLDAAGSVYVSDNTQSSANGAVDNVFALKNDGTQKWISSAGSLFYDAQQIGTDTTGHVWLANDSGSTTNTGQAAHILCYLQTDGTPCTPIAQTASPYILYAYALAVDRANNVWVGSATTATANYQLWRANAGSATATTISGKQLQNIESMAFDSNQNLWIGYYASSSSANSTSAYLPKTSSGWGTYSEFTLAANGSANTYYIKGTAVDGSNHAVYAAHSAVATVTPSVDGNGYITGVSSQANQTLNGTAPTWNMVDGMGVNWYFGSAATLYGTTSNGEQYGYGTSAPGLQPCQLVGGVTACGSSVSTGSSVTIDDAGTMWIAYSSTSKPGIMEVIGTAAPVWSQLSWGHPGVLP